MAHGIQNMNRNNRCPICGKPDWCGWMDARNGGQLVFCHRTDSSSLTKGKDGVIGHDGNYYIFVGLSRSGSPVFEEANQRLAKQRLEEGLDVKNFDTSTIQKKVLTPVDIVEPLSDHKKLSAVYNRLLDLLVLEEEDYLYLLSEGWTDELIKKHKVKSFPVDDYTRFKNQGCIHSKNPWRVSLGKTLSAEFDSLCGIPGAYRNQKGNWTFAPAAGILFPLYDENGDIYRLRVRVKNVKEGGKYRNFSSYRVDKKAEEQGFLMNLFADGCRAGNHLGFYMNRAVDDMYLAYITEGEKKGILGNSILKNPFISVPGVNSFEKLTEGSQGNRPVDVLKKMGIQIFVIAFDADKNTNSAVLSYEKKTIEMLKNEGFQIGIAYWDMVQGKGIDDLLANGYRPNYQLV